jgi:hypothetical protein
MADETTTTPAPELNFGFLVPVHNAIDWAWNNYVVKAALVFIAIVYLAQLVFKLVRDVF